MRESGREVRKEKTAFTKLAEILTLSVGILFAGSVVLIFSLSLLSISHVGHLGYIYLCSDRTGLQVLFLGFLVLFLFFASRSRALQSFAGFAEQDEKYRLIRNTLLLIMALMGAVYVLASQFRPVADQWAVISAADHLRHHFFTDFQKGGYIYKYTNQIGLVLTEYSLGLIFGDQNHVLFQLLNVAAYVGIAHEILLVSERLGLRRIYSLFSLLLCLLFAPLIFYTEFVYGNLIGECCSLMAIRFELEYLERPKKRPRLCIFAGVLLALSVVVKQNYLIFGLGMLAYAVIDNLRFHESKGKHAILYISLVSALFLGITVPRSIAEGMTGQELSHGMSASAYVMMGLQDSEHWGPGWWNGYNDRTYEEAGFDPDRQKEAVKKDLEERLLYFKENPGEMIRFFLRKVTSEWGEPSFESLWITRYRETDISLPSWIWAVNTVKGWQVVSGILNYLHIGILFGVLWFIGIILKNGKEAEGLLPYMIIFCGGFVFHLFWEAKAQYTLSYFILLIPVSVCGYHLGLRELRSLSDNRSVRALHPGLWAPAVLIFIVCCLSAMLPLTFIRGDDERYEASLLQYDESGAPKNGSYLIHTNNDSVCMGASGEGMAEGSAEENYLYVFTYQGISHITDPDTSLYLTACERDDSGVYQIEWQSAAGDASQEFKIRQTGENLYTIEHNDQLLTKEGNGYVLKQWVDSDCQRWLFEKEP
ncbi:MAG: hypothetical protein K6G83_11370 [Lachnospiraceae bacterium]|nr:hypothetical protein [Lachnospiraceae bacterium]